MAGLCDAYGLSFPTTSAPVFSSADMNGEASDRPTDDVAKRDEECYNCFEQYERLVYMVGSQKNTHYVAGYFEGYENELWATGKLLSFLIKSDCLKKIAWSVRWKILFVSQDNVLFFDLNEAFYACFIIEQSSQLMHLQLTYCMTAAAV